MQTAAADGADSITAAAILFYVEFRGNDSARTPSNLTEVLRGFPQTLEANEMIVP
jgi:hypothetical protein